MTTEAALQRPADEVADVLAQLIRLLADDAPAGELAEIERRARALAGPQRALLDRAVDHARQVAGKLDRRARRMRELTALYETARDLTSLRDVDAVLTSIVERVRRLLGTDSTYIALVDDRDGDIYMRVTSGTLTPAIRSVRQAPGSGVGGRVIQTGQPFATTNYLADPRLHRDPAVAGAVGADGIVSIAGAPMKLRQRVIGALLAANRYERTFEQPEIAVLSSLAHHAAVVIENARLFDQVRSAARELGEVHAQLSARRRELELADAAHESLMPLALTQASLDELTSTLAGIFGGTVRLEPGAEPSGEQPPSAAVPLRAGGQTYGRLTLDRADPVTDAEARVLESAAQTATLLILLRHQRSIVEQELRRELVEDILAGTEPDWARLRERADRLGLLADDDPHTLVVLSSQAPLHAVLDAAGNLSVARRGLAGEHTGQVVLVVPADGEDPGVTARAVAAELGRVLGEPVTAGAAGPAASVRAIRPLHRAAARCHALLLSLGRDGDGAAIGELGVLGHVLGTASPDQLRRIVNHALGPLLEYDAHHASALLETARCYFAQGRSTLAAARALGIHSNTLYQRLERIDRVLGGRRWREPGGAVDMQVALELYDIMSPRLRP